jgi:hypothetical protein
MLGADISAGPRMQLTSRIWAVNLDVICFSFRGLKRQEWVWSDRQPTNSKLDRTIDPETIRHDAEPESEPGYSIAQARVLLHVPSEAE